MQNTVVLCILNKIGKFKAIIVKIVDVILFSVVGYTRKIDFE